MKKYFFLLLISLPLLAQNPDGDKASIHITPLLINGQLASFGGVLNGEEINTKLDQTLNVDIMLKLPISKSFTITPIFEYRMLRLGEKENTISSFGARFSFYFD